MLHYNTVSDTLRSTLILLMAAPIFSDFRLVGGTSLSLQIGHRESVDIDLFTDLPYGDVDFMAIDRFLESTFPVCLHISDIMPGLGKSYEIGNLEADKVKLDVFYTDPFIQTAMVIDDIRLATIEEIIAMKIDVIQGLGRKKDFWDLHALLPEFSLNKMIKLHKLRYPYSHEEKLILRNFTNFDKAEGEFDPVCFRGESWDIIKMDLIDVVDEHFKK